LFQLTQIRERIDYPVPYRPTPLAVDGDAALLAAIGHGDSGALSLLFDRHGAAVLGLLTRMLGRGGEADEVLQEVFLWLWNHADRYDGSRSSLRGWLLVLARSRALDLLRSDRSRRAREAGVGRERPTVHHPAPLADLEERERQGRLRAALGILPEEQRRCIELAFFNGLSHTQIATRLEQPLGTVKSRIQLGMGKLRAALAQTLAAGPVAAGA
jgi:RNA polymerase sigma-70 factor (ECF subfamily)